MSRDFSTRRGALQNGDLDPRAQSGEYSTTAQELQLADTDRSLKVGARSRTVLEDFHLRDKITHFDHERIPERVVVNASGKTSLVKFHWKPIAGVHSPVWEEPQIAAGCDPAFRRRDMTDGMGTRGLTPRR